MSNIKDYRKLVRDANFQMDKLAVEILDNIVELPQPGDRGSYIIVDYKDNSETIEEFEYKTLCNVDWPSEINDNTIRVKYEILSDLNKRVFEKSGSSHEEYYYRYFIVRVDVSTDTPEIVDLYLG